MLQDSKSNIDLVMHRLDNLDPPRRAALTEVAFPPGLPQAQPGLWAVLSEFGASLVDCGAVGLDEQQVAASNQCF